MIKQIYAIVSDKEFYMFRKKAYSENLTFGKALTALAIAYGKGEISLNNNSQPKEKKKPNMNAYLIDKDLNIIGKKSEEGGK